MTDMDSGLTQGANPTGDASNGSSIVLDSEGLSALLKRLDVVEQQSRAQQGDKDRGVNEVRKEIPAIKEDLATFRKYLETYGDEAEWRYNVDTQLQRLQAGGSSSGDSSGTDALAGQQVPADNKRAELFQSLGVDVQSVEYLAEIGKGNSSEQAALNVLAAKQAALAQGDPSYASGVSGGGGTGSLSATAQEVLRQQREKELDTKTFWTPWELQQLNAKYQKLGLPVE
jgi:hypothetical protein